jgi:hypothetical protein
MKPSESSFRQIYVDMLSEEIRELADSDNISVHTAAVRVLLNWLGYDSEEIIFIDSADNGIDAWYATEDGVEIFQVKTHSWSDDGLIILDKPFDNEGVADLRRAKDFLLYTRDVNIKNKELKELLSKWTYALYNRKYQEATVAMPVTLRLVILGQNLTPQAQREFDTFQDANAEVANIDDIPLQFRAVLHSVSDVIDGKWREDNRSWSDAQNRKQESITLTPIDEDKFISENANAVFYCLAIDLVEAYETLGYQIFEPNVRAHIKKSRINLDIRSSLTHQRSRRDFRFLNNGVTLICDGFNKPSGQRKSFLVHHPGIVNGLQTVVALHTAYKELAEFDREDFRANCSVLVRLLNSNAVNDINRVVQATNNQNPMQPRNLKSNNAEQLEYAYIFADLGWFYENKQGAWDAFSNGGHKRWRPPLNKNPKDFKSGRKVRRVDNWELAQNWLAFVGFATEAANEKKALFDVDYYELIFLAKTRKHGFYYDGLKHAHEDAEKNSSPDPSLMLVAHLSREFAQSVPLSSRDNKQKACERLRIDPKTISRAELDVELSKDDIFVLNQALGGMSLLFTEFIGFILYRALGENVHRYGRRLLNTQSFYYLATEFVSDPIIEQIDANNFREDDLLIVLWLAIVDTIERLLADDWGQSYRTANIKVRYIFSSPTRKRLYKQIESTDTLIKKKGLRDIWAADIPEGQGLFDFVRTCVVG